MTDSFEESGDRLRAEHFISGTKSEDTSDPDFHPSVLPSAKSNLEQKTYVNRRKEEPAGDLNESDFSSSWAAAVVATSTKNPLSSKLQDYKICLPGNGPQMFVQWETMSR